MSLGWTVALAAALCLLGCAPPPGARSHGRPNRGMLVDGVAMGRAGPGFVQARPGDGTRYGTPTLVRALERALASVAARYPGTPPMRVGDLSYRHGGKHPRHGSHRSGRDADLIFFATDLSGRSVQGRGWLAYDRFGVARETKTPSGEGSGDVFLFDAARNWHLVRTLLADEQALVQWIFCSAGIKARLLRHAALHEADPRLIARAATVLHQPSRGRSHNDHFHVRVLCSPEERQSGCREYGPVWPWLRDAVEKTSPREPVEHTDENLVRWLMEDPPGSGEVATPKSVGSPAPVRHPG